MNIIDEIEQEQIKEITEKRMVPEFGPGDTLKVHLKVVEGTRERIQVFEGLCIARSNRSLNSSFTVSCAYCIIFSVLSVEPSSTTIISSTDSKRVRSMMPTR